MHLILRQFLSNPSLSIEDLAELCLCSESTINRDMKLVKNRLEEYHLSLVKDKNAGLRISGSEWHIRLALISEYNLYNEFEAVQQFGIEQAVNEMFMHQGIFIDMLIDRLQTAYSLCDYHVPYHAFDDMANMIILTITRRNHAEELNQCLNWFREANVEKEKEVIRVIFAQLPVLADFTLSEAELYALSIYLRAHRVIRYHDFLKMEESETVQETVSGFLRYLSELYRYQKTNMEILKKDLCCELTRLKWKEDYNINTQRYRVNNFTRDGMLSLDFCTLLYQYLKTRKQHISIRSNTAMFYYIFSQFNRQIRGDEKIRILVVSKNGFYVARSLAGNIRRKINTDNLEINPIEYYELQKQNMSEVDCILTDIETLADTFYYKPVYLIRYYRSTEEISRLIRKISIDRFHYEDLFLPEDLYYLDTAETYEDVEEFVLNKMLKETDDKEKVRQGFREKGELFSLDRGNQILVLNTLSDCIGRDFLKVLLLDNPIEYNNNIINKVIFYNVKDSDLVRLTDLTQRIAQVLHHGEMISFRSRKEDYDTLRKLMFEV